MSNHEIKSIERNFDQDPAYQERLRRWEELDAEMNRAAKSMYGNRIEPGINNTAVGINAVLGGYYTNMSCEGHEDQEGTFPWVSFHRASDAQLDGLDDLLDDFYEDRETPEDVQLALWDRVMGGAAHTLMSVVAHEVQIHYDDDALHARNAATLEAQQTEMTDFAAYMKRRHLEDGYSLAKPTTDWSDDFTDNDG